MHGLGLQQRYETVVNIWTLSIVWTNESRLGCSIAATIHKRIVYIDLKIQYPLRV